MIFANVWLGLRQEAHALVMERLRWDEETDGPYSGPVTHRENQLFRYMADLEGTQRLFKVATVGGKQWTLWNLNFTERLSAVKVRLDTLVAERGSMVAMVGAWNWDGSQIGTEHVFSTRSVTRDVSRLNPLYQPDDQLPNFDPRFVIREPMTFDEEYISGFTGTPMYPIPTAQLLKFMPDGIMQDRNVAAGQSPRSFS
jgi:hypothetical protein